MATKTSKTVARPKRSRAEVEQEFADIREEVGAAQETLDLKAEELAKQKEAETRRAVEGMTVESVVQTISGLGIEVSKALSDVSAKLVQEVNSLASVREAVELERRELERLHKIDVAATALDQLVQDHARQKERLEAEIAAQRKAWEEELLETERGRKEQEENLKKQRQREIEEYDYRKALERKKAQDKYEEEMRLQEKQNKEKQEALEKSWKQREQALKEKEEESARLKKEAEEFPARLQQAATQAVAEAVRAAEQKHDQQLILLKKENEADKRLAELQIKAFEETISRQQAQIAALQKQLDEAKQQVQEIAVKAIEGASGARALAHVNQIAIEQAKHRTPQG
jgi:DNA repair exonuclease SbcCD ATPase subunit